MTPIANKEQGLIEIVKYGSKIFTEPDVKNRAKKKSKSYIYVSALDNILSAMEGRRMFDRFGFNLPNDLRKFKPKTALHVTEFEEWNYNSGCSNWINSKTGEILTDYKISQELFSILNNNIDLQLQ